MKPASPRSARASGRVTLADVARLAEVSTMTASRALRGQAGVDPALVERVRQAAERLAYVPDPAARALASQRSNHVAVLIPSLTNRLFVDLLEAAQQTLHEAGFQTLVGITHYDPQAEEQLVQEQLLHRPAGLLLTGLDQTRRARRLIADTPCVHMMELATEAELSSVGFSQHAAAAAMTLHLLARGYQRIAFAAAQLDPRTRQRLQGWRDTLVAAGRHDARLEWLDPAPSSVALGAQMLERIVHAEPRADAVFFCNDDLAHGALLAAWRLGLAVPQHIAIAGFNDLPESAHMVPPLTSVRTPLAAIGQGAARQLLCLLAGQAPSHQELPFELQLRQSS